MGAQPLDHLQPQVGLAKDAGLQEATDVLHLGPACMLMVSMCFEPVTDDELGAQCQVQLIKFAACMLPGAG